MQAIVRAFYDHPATVGETYGEHARFAFYFASRLFAASIAALIHAMLPFLFERTASNIIKDLHSIMSSRGRKLQ